MIKVLRFSYDSKQHYEKIYEFINDNFEDIEITSFYPAYFYKNGEIIKNDKNSINVKEPFFKKLFYENFSFDENELNRILENEFDIVEINFPPYSKAAYQIIKNSKHKNLKKILTIKRNIYNFNSKLYFYRKNLVLNSLDFVIINNELNKNFFLLEKKNVPYKIIEDFFIVSDENYPVNNKKQKILISIFCDEKFTENLKLLLKKSENFSSQIKLALHDNETLYKELSEIYETDLITKTSYEIKENIIKNSDIIIFFKKFDFDNSSEFIKPIIIGALSSAVVISNKNKIYEKIFGEHILFFENLKENFLNDIIKDATLREKFSTKLSNFVKNNYSLSKISLKYLEIYKFLYRLSKIR